MTHVNMVLVQLLKIIDRYEFQNLHIWALPEVLEYLAVGLINHYDIRLGYRYGRAIFRAFADKKRSFECQLFISLYLADLPVAL